MSSRGFIKWPLLALAALITVVLGALFVLTRPAVQTNIAKRALSSVNESLRGNLEFDQLSAAWNGQIEILGLSIFDETGVEIAAVDTVRAHLFYHSLLADTIHLQSLTLRGTSIDLLFDSTGHFNLATAFSPVAPAAPTTVPSPWVIIIDPLEIAGNKVQIHTPERAFIDATYWSLAGNVRYAHDSLNYSTTLAIPGWMELDAGGVIETGNRFSAAGAAGFIIENRAIQQLDSPLAQLQQLSGHSEYRLTSDSLFSILDVRSSAIGHLTGTMAMSLNLAEPALHCSLELDSVRPSILWGDSTPLKLQGTIIAEKEPTADWVNRWTVKANLIDPSYGAYRADRADLQAEIQDSLLRLDAMLFVASGQAVLRGELDVFRTTQRSGDLFVSAVNLPLNKIIAEVPDSLANLTGQATLRFSQRAQDPVSAELNFSLRNAGTGTWHGDSLVGTVHVRSGDVNLDTATVWLSGARADLAGDWLADGTLQSTLSLSVSNLADLNKLTFFQGKLDSLSGTLYGNLAVTGNTSTTGAFPYRLRGTIYIDSLQYREQFVERTTLKILDAASDSSTVSGVARFEQLMISGQKLDSATLVFRGIADSLAVQLQLWAVTDTAEARADFTLLNSGDTWKILLHRLLANTYRIAWQTEGESIIELQETAATVDALILRSAYGTLIASGTVARPGDQDLALEVSGVELEDWSKLAGHSLPAGLLNARVMISGPDSNITGDLSATIDSIQYDSQLLADRVTVDAVANSVATSFKTLYTLHGDSIAFARGSLPARLTFSEGFVLDPELPLSGRVTLHDHPWTLGFPFLPYGSEVSGRMKGELSVLGSPARPDWLGTLECRDGRFKDSRYGLDYRNIRADLELHRDTLAISNLSLSSTGELSGSGQAVLAFPLPKALDLTLNFENFSAVDSRNLRARVTGAARIQGPLDSLKADGSVRFSEGVYRVTQSTTKEIEEIDLAAELAKLRGDTTVQQGILLSRFYQPMSHAIYVDIPGNVWLRGSGMNVELFGGLWMYKTADEAPYMNGEIKVKRGTVEFAGHEFLTDQDSGSVAFSGPVDNPDLNIIAVEQSILRQSDDRIRIRIFGSLQNSQMELSGNRADGSAMTVEEVLQRMFGAFIPLGLDKSGGSDLTGSITSAGVSQLANMVGKMAGLDVFQFRPGSGGLTDLSGSSLEVGTYLTDRLFVRVLQPIESVQGTQDVLVEYRLFDWLKLAGHQTGTKSSEFKTILQWEWH